MGLSAAYSFTVTDRGYVGLQNYERKMITKIDRFTADGTFTVPAGVTYAIAHIRAGGGGIGNGTNAGAGGNSSVAFAGGTITATGGGAQNFSFGGGGGPGEKLKVAGATNSGWGAKMVGSPSNYADGERFFVSAGDGAYIVAGGAVTAGTGITITVGAGGTAGTYSAQTGAAGGSGYVWIEYQVTA